MSEVNMSEEIVQSESASEIKPVPKPKKRDRKKKESELVVDEVVLVEEVASGPSEELPIEIIPVETVSAVDAEPQETQETKPLPKRRLVRPDRPVESEKIEPFAELSKRRGQRHVRPQSCCQDRLENEREFGLIIKRNDEGDFVMYERAETDVEPTVDAEGRSFDSQGRIIVEDRVVVTLVVYCPWCGKKLE